MTNTHNNRPPLWEAMRNASLLDPFATSRESYAAEIRALRDWLLPEESIQGEPGRFVNGCCLKTCQSIRALLTAEADRAEHS